MLCHPRFSFPQILLVAQSILCHQGASDGITGRKNGTGMDAFRVSLSSAVSSSTQGSGNNDGDALGDVFIWGEGTGDGILGGGIHRDESSSGVKIDSLVPRPMESAAVLDVQNIYSLWSATCCFSNQARRGFLLGGGIGRQTWTWCGL
jgi:hypothetical protein